MCRLRVNKVLIITVFIIAHCGNYLFSHWLRIQKSYSLSIPLLIISTRAKSRSLNACREGMHDFSLVILSSMF